MRLSKQTTDSVRILVVCARAYEDGVALKVASIAEQVSLSRQNALKLVNALIHIGYLEGTRGRNGGVRLTAAPSTIVLGGAVRQLEKRLTLEPVGGAAEEIGLRDMYDDAMTAFTEVLDMHTLAELAGIAPGPRERR